MSSLGSLVIELAANTARLQSDLGKAVGMAESAGRKFSGAFRGIAALAGAGSITALVSQSIELGDNLNKAAIKAGLGAKPMSELAHAAKMADVDLTSLSTALKKMQVNLSEAKTGAKGSVEALGALGLNVKELLELQPDKQFELIGDRISQLKDPADKARAATELFGRAGADLLPLFEGGARGIRMAREEAERLGVSFGDETLKALADADDSVKRLKASWDGLAAVLTAKVAPGLSAVLDLLHGEAGPFGYFPLFANDAEEEMYTHLANVKKNGRQIEPTRGRYKKSAAGGFTKEMTDAEKAAQAKKLKDIQDDTFTAYIEGVRAQITVEQEWEQINKESIQSVSSSYEDMTEILTEATADTLKETEEAFGEMSVYAEQAGRNMQDALADFLFDPFKDGLQGMLRGFIDIIRRMIAEAAAADIFDAISGGKGGNLSGIFKGVGKLFGGFKAAGGPVSGGTSYIVGERGPELFTPGSGGFISPNGSGRGGGINVTINAPYSTKDSVQELRAMVPSIIQQSVQLARVAVREDVRSGALR